VSVSNVAELIEAIENSGIDKILVAAGTYNFTTAMCTTPRLLERGYSYGMAGTDGDLYTDWTAICINRALTIEAQVPGTVVLNAENTVRRSLNRSQTHDLNGYPLPPTFLEKGLRVLSVDSGGTARLIGLNITGGYASVRCVAL
jgi:hypothetical protein